MSTALNREIVLQTLQGYKEVNAITTVERAAWLAQLSPAEGWAVFTALYEAWEMTGKKAGGDWEALAHQRLEEALALRRAFELAARRRGWI